MKKERYNRKTTVHIKDRRTDAAIEEFRKKNEYDYSEAAQKLIERGLASFDYEFMNADQLLRDIRAMQGEINTSIAALTEITMETNEAVLRDTDEAAALRLPLLEIIAELWLVGRLEFKKKYPEHYAKRAETVAAQVGEIRRYASRRSGSNA